MKSISPFFATFAFSTALALLIHSNSMAQTNEPVELVTTAKTNPAPFVFPGGTPDQFVEAVDKHYGVDWRSVASIPGEMSSVQIPRLRLSPESLERIIGGRRGPFGRGGGGGSRGKVASNDDGPLDPLQGLMVLYNSLQQSKPELGQLRIEGDLKKPSVVIFSSSGIPQPELNFKMKAFPLRGIPEKDWGQLVGDLDNAIATLLEYNQDAKAGRIKRDSIRVSLHKDTALMLVVGPESLMETVDSIVTAWHANQEVKNHGLSSLVLPK